MRLHESRTRPFQAPATVHTFPGRQVFVFPNGRSDSEESEEEELNVMELRPRGKEQPRGSARDRLGDVVLLERELTQEDSLNKLALQYGCKVRGERCLCLGLFSSQGFQKVTSGLELLVLESVGPASCMNGHCLGKTGERQKKPQTNTEKSCSANSLGRCCQPHTLPDLLSCLISVTKCRLY